MRIKLALAAVLLCSPAWADMTEVPDPQKTPGAVATSDVSEICGRENGLTYTKRHRVWTGQRDTMAKYGIPYSQKRDYEDDDEVPVCLGGDNANPANHWPQPSDRLTHLGYESKDKLDALSCHLVCTGAVTVQEAQSWFLAPADWRVAYRRYYHDR